MRFVSTLEGSPLGPEQRQRALTRFRLALGALEAEVRSLKVRFEVRGGEHSCAATTTLKDGLVLEVESRGSSFEDVLAFVARRSASVVSLRLRTNRLLES